MRKDKAMGLRIGVDVGGSFTDFAVLDEATRTIRTLKVFSRPDSPGSEVLAGMEGLRERSGIEPREGVYSTHGTTDGVTAARPRKGAKVGPVPTGHFEARL